MHVIPVVASVAETPGSDTRIHLCQASHWLRGCRGEFAWQLRQRVYLDRLEQQHQKTAKVSVGYSSRRLGTRGKQIQNWSDQELGLRKEWHETSLRVHYGITQRESRHSDPASPQLP